MKSEQINRIVNELSAVFSFQILEIWKNLWMPSFWTFVIFTEENTRFSKRRQFCGKIIFTFESKIYSLSEGFFLC